MLQDTHRRAHCQNTETEKNRSICKLHVQRKTGTDCRNELHHISIRSTKFEDNNNKTGAISSTVERLRCVQVCVYRENVICKSPKKKQICFWLSRHLAMSDVRMQNPRTSRAIEQIFKYSVRVHLRSIPRWRDIASSKVEMWKFQACWKMNA